MEQLLKEILVTIENLPNATVEGMCYKIRTMLSQLNTNENSTNQLTDDEEGNLTQILIILGDLANGVGSETLNAEEKQQIVLLLEDLVTHTNPQEITEENQANILNHFAELRLFDVFLELIAAGFDVNARDFDGIDVLSTISNKNEIDETDQNIVQEIIATATVTGLTGHLAEFMLYAISNYKIDLAELNTEVTNDENGLPLAFYAIFGNAPRMWELLANYSEFLMNKEPETCAEKLANTVLQIQDVYGIELFQEQQNEEQNAEYQSN